MLVRPFQPRDAADLGRVEYRSVHEVGSARYSPSQVEVWAPAVPSEESYLQRANDGRVFLVAVNVHDRPIAYGDLTPVGHIEYLYCEPEATRTGIVKALYLQLEHAAIQQNINLLSTNASELARSFFKKRGFLVVQRRDFVLKGVLIHNYRMEKRLGS